jgi:hypothetical protein
MAHVTREIRIDAPAGKGWEVLADVGGIYRYNPNGASSHTTSEVKRGVGVTRHCDLTLSGATVEERIVEWTEGESYLVDIYGGSKLPPFKRAGARISLRPDGGGTIVTGTLEYSLKFGPVGLLMDRLLVAPRFSLAWTQLFAGLEHYVETGHEVNDGTPLRLEAVLATRSAPPAANRLEAQQ